MPINLSEIKTEHFCIAPWVNVHIHQSGGIRPCCFGDDFGKIQSDDWSYIDGTNENLAQLKESLLNNEKTQYCKNCFEKPWYDEFHNENVVIDNINDFVLKGMDIRWGTTCQLSCMYCDSHSSTTWASIHTKLKHFIPIQNGRAYRNKTDHLFEFISKHAKSLKRVSLLGGEPLLLKENIQLLDILEDHTQIDIFTNLNIDLDNEIFNKLINRPNVNWRVSMENVGKRFEFVRRGSNWDVQEKNLRYLDSLNKKFTIHSQYCVYSALNIAEMYDFANTIPNASIDWNLNYTKPEAMNFFNMPPHFKNLALLELDKVQSKCVQYDEIKQKLLNTMGSFEVDAVQKCINFHEDYESLYFENKLSFTNLWPQYETY